MESSSLQQQQQQRALFRHKFKNTLLEWCLVSTNPAIPKMIRNQSWIIRIVWILCFLASLGYCASTIIDSFVEYLNYETTLSIRKVHELPATYPAVTFCNINPINEAYAFDYLDRTEQFIEEQNCLIKKNATRSSIPQNCTSNGPSMEIFSSKLKRVIANDRNITQAEREALGFDLFEDMLAQCRFNSYPCSKNQFQKWWSHEHGNCYTYNSGRNSSLFKTSTVGSKQGLRIELVVKPADVYTTFAYKTGIYLVIHNQSTSPFTLTTGIHIPTGFETYVGINRVLTNKLKSPYSNCIDSLETENPYARKLFAYFRQLNVFEYSQQFCFTMCLQDKLIDRCQCADILTPAIRNSTPFCSTDSQIECMTAYFISFSTSNLNELCESACLEECSSIEYTYDISMATFPTESYILSLKANPNLTHLFPEDDTELIDFARDSFLKVIINYENLYYTSIEESAKITVMMLFGNLGGQLSLFIGISVLSFCDLIELLVEMLLLCYYHRQETRRTDVEKELND